MSSYRRDARVLACVIVVSVTTALRAQSPTELSSDPFVFLRATIQFSDDDRRKLDDRDVVVRILPADGHELAAMAAVSLDVGPETFVRSMRNTVDLKTSPLVPQLGRFSPRPRLEDLRALTLEDVDVAEIRQCAPERCGLKLQADEITRLQRTIAADVADAPRDQLEQELRRVLVERAQRYLLHGDGGSAAPFSTLLQHSPYVQARMPFLVGYLERYPAIRLADAESFLYWSKEMYAWKPMITITHVAILRGDGATGAPEVLVASRDIFSSRYTSASFTLTLLSRSSEAPLRRYLVYINRTWVDGVRALWRPIVEYRIKKQARAIFADVRARIERNGAGESAGTASSRRTRE